MEVFMNAKNIFLFAICFLSIFLLSSCTKNPPTTDKFEEVCKNFGYKIKHVKKTDIENVKTLIFAKNKDCEIEFYVIDSNETAFKLFDREKRNLEFMYKRSEKVKGYAFIKSFNLCKFTMGVDDNYIVISRIDDIYIHIKAKYSDKEAVDGLLFELGFYDDLSLFFDNLVKEITAFFNGK